MQFPGHWALSHTLPLDYPVLSVSWNKEGRKLLVGGDIVSLWVHSQEEGVTYLLPPDPNLSGEGSDGVWGELWRCPLAQPAIHLSFSPDGAMFATASQDDHFVKIWYHSRIGVCVCVSVCVCVCVCVCAYTCTHFKERDCSLSAFLLFCGFCFQLGKCVGGTFCEGSNSS